MKLVVSLTTNRCAKPYHSSYRHVVRVEVRPNLHADLRRTTEVYLTSLFLSALVDGNRDHGRVIWGFVSIERET